MVTPLRSGPALLMRAVVRILTGMVMASSASASVLPGDYKLKAQHSGRCLDIQGASYNTGGSVIQWDCRDSENQTFRITALAEGYFQIAAKHSGQCLDVANANSNNGAKVQQWLCTGALHQQWNAVQNTDGSYTFLARHSGKALDVQGVSTSNGANVFQWSPNGRSNQRFQLISAGGTQPPVDTPPVSLPGRLEAEDYVTYFDTTQGNTGGAFRTDNVDMEVTVDSGGGYNVGWIEATEYLRYKINVQQSGRYKITARVATPNSGRNFALKLNGNEIGRFNLPNTGGWQEWQDVSINVNLNEGQQDLELYFDTPLLNLNYIDVEQTDDGGTDPTDPTNPNNGGWRLTWSDEFNGSSIDLSKWEHEVNAQGGGNNELQYYTARRENSYVSNGTLKLVARKERYSGPEGTRDYTSGRLRSRNKGDWKYGRMEVSARLPYSQGLWPAIWMLPTDNKYGSWAASGEIDIMEAVNLRGRGGNKVYGTLHYGGTWPGNVHSGKSYDSTRSVVDHFHQYAIEWEAGEIRWYVDGKHYQTQREWWSGNANAKYPAPFDQRFHLLLNVAVGGNWPGNPDGSSQFPQTMEVDYVRVYQKDTGTPPTTGNTLRVMSINVRTEDANDPGERNWQSRKSEVVRAIQSQNPSLIGLQEATGAQHDYIKGSLGANWSSSPQRQFIYRNDQFDILSGGVIELIADQWGRRSSEWATMRHKSDGKSFVFLNNHWGVDNASQQGSANILRDRLRQVNQNWTVPTILLGDLNAVPNSGPINTIVDQTPLDSYISGATFNGWSTQGQRQLDYILGHRFNANGCVVVTYREGSYPPSDHFPVACNLQFR